MEEDTEEYDDEDLDDDRRMLREHRRRILADNAAESVLDITHKDDVVRKGNQWESKAYVEAGYPSEEIEEAQSPKTGSENLFFFTD